MPPLPPWLLSRPLLRWRRQTQANTHAHLFEHLHSGVDVGGRWVLLPNRLHKALDDILHTNNIALCGAHVAHLGLGVLRTTTRFLQRPGGGFSVSVKRFLDFGQPFFGIGQLNAI